MSRRSVQGADPHVFYKENRDVGQHDEWSVVVWLRHVTPSSALHELSRDRYLAPRKVRDHRDHRENPKEVVRECRERAVISS